MKATARILGSWALAALLLAVAMGALSGGSMGPVAPAYAAPLISRGIITPTQILATGIAQSLSAANGDGHKFTNTGDDFIVVANGYTDTITLTVVTGGTVSGLDIEDVDVVVAAGQTKMVGPFETGVFNQTSGSDAGKLYLNWNSAITGTIASNVTLGVYRLQ